MKILKNKNIITAILMLIAFCLILIGITGCSIGNKEIFDTTYVYKTAICNIAGEWKEIEIKKWTDYEGEQIQIWDEYDNYYLVSSINCTLMSSKLKENKDGNN